LIKLRKRQWTRRGDVRGNKHNDKGVYCWLMFDESELDCTVGEYRQLVFYHISYSLLIAGTYIPVAFAPFIGRNGRLKILEIYDVKQD